MNQAKKKFLLLYLRTGGGHLAPANAIAEYFAKHKSDEVETVLYDGFERSKKIIKIVVVDGYRILQNKAKWIYELIYAIHKIKIVAKFESRLVNQFIEKHLEHEIEFVKPDKIVIFHFFMVEPIFRILRRKNLTIPVITIVTDPFTPHPLWFLNKDQNFIVFSEKLRKQCIQEGIDPARITAFPFPLNERFSLPPTTEQIQSFKSELGFKSEKVLLILGGGDGIPKGIPIIKSLCRKPVNYKIIFVCGNNTGLFNCVMKLKEKNNYDFLTVFGFTKNIFELINIADAVITKCGASTIMEILISGKTPVVNSYIWEQEKGNVEFLVENKFGVFEKQINELSGLVQDIFLNTQERFKNSEIKNGTPEVADYLLN
jgi:UDP-N-acetylglucosamine:LPS N-acetylglucosamine transferase